MPGDDHGYEAYVKYLYDRDIAPQISRFRAMREMLGVPPGVEWEYALSRLAEADATLRLIATIPDVYGTFRAEALAKLISDVSAGVEANSRMLIDLRIADVLDSEYRALAAGMSPEHLPAEETALLRSFGFTALADSWPGLVYQARARAEESAAVRQGEERLIVEMNNLAERLNEAARDHERLGEMEEELAALKHGQQENSQAAKKLNQEAEAKKRRPRWWKGLGQIAAGAGLSLADTALVAGPHVVVTAPAALVSWTAGVGTLMGGIGDLRAE